MRALLIVVLLARAAAAESLPSGSMGIIVGAVAGTGPDANRLGYGYLEPLSFHAAWQPMRTESRVGWAVRWTTMFTSTYGASAAEVADLQTMQMDFTLGLRVRPWGNVRRYLTVRGGPALFRANQTIPPKMQRAFIGPVASIGFEQYLIGTLLLLDFDVRYGLIGDAPTQIVFTAGLSIAGP
ncbi:MAG: hypothetical protein ABI867_25940 [Kofleriaceae bacterium]